MGKLPTKSELRTLKTKAGEGLRVAKLNYDGNEQVLNTTERGTPEYRAVQRCVMVAKTILDQCQAVVNDLNEKAREVGTYKKGGKSNEQTEAGEQDNVYADTV